MNSFFTKYKNPLTVIIILIILGGAFVYSRLQTSLFPSITFPKIKIIADAGLQPVNKMMVTVTKPLENAVKQVPDLADVRSITSRGSCEISAFMNWTADIDLSQQRIESKIAQIRNELPAGTQITVEKMNPSILPVMGYTLETTGASTPIDMKQLALYTVKPFLSQVQGVAEIRIIGGKQKEYWLTLNPQKMGVLGITPDILSAALSQTNFIQSGGYIQDYRQLYLTVTDATVHSVYDLENIIVANNGR
ncbi:MAG: efflux RND transporter permease subunit, partial [Bacteroidota bacterium]